MKKDKKVLLAIRSGANIADNACDFAYENKSEKNVCQRGVYMA